MQLLNTNAAACVEHVSTQATGQYVYTNIALAAVVHLTKKYTSRNASRGTDKFTCSFSYCILFWLISVKCLVFKKCQNTEFEDFAPLLVA